MAETIFKLVHTKDMLSLELAGITVDATNQKVNCRSKSKLIVSCDLVTYRVIHYLDNQIGSSSSF